MNTTKEEAAGFSIIAGIIAAIFIAVTSGCGNMRVYMGVDDYGEPKEFHHDFKAGPSFAELGAGAPRRGN